MFVLAATEGRAGDGRTAAGTFPAGCDCSWPTGFCGHVLQGGCGDGFLMTDDVSVTRLASLILGSVVAAHGALVELADRGWLYDQKSDELMTVYHQAVDFTAQLYSLLGQRKKEAATAGDGFRKVIEAIQIMAGECEHLSEMASEQAKVDARFQKIADSFHQPGDVG